MLSIKDNFGTTSDFYEVCLNADSILPPLQPSLKLKMFLRVISAVTSRLGLPMYALPLYLSICRYIRLPIYVLGRGGRRSPCIRHDPVPVGGPDRSGSGGGGGGGTGAHSF